MCIHYAAVKERNKYLSLIEYHLQIISKKRMNLRSCHSNQSDKITETDYAFVLAAILNFRPKKGNQFKNELISLRSTSLIVSYESYTRSYPKQLSSNNLNRATHFKVWIITFGSV